MIEDQYALYLPTYCYHCGKQLKDDEKFLKWNIHKKCFDTRLVMVRKLKKLRWKILMEDPNTRKIIEEVDKRILFGDLKKVKE